MRDVLPPLDTVLRLEQRVEAEVEAEGQVRRPDKGLEHPRGAERVRDRSPAAQPPAAQKLHAPLPGTAAAAAAAPPAVSFVAELGVSAQEEAELEAELRLAEAEEAAEVQLLQGSVALAANNTVESLQAEIARLRAENGRLKNGGGGGAAIEGSPEPGGLVSLQRERDQLRAESERLRREDHALRQADAELRRQDLALRQMLGATSGAAAAARRRAFSTLSGQQLLPKEKGSVIALVGATLAAVAIALCCCQRYVWAAFDDDSSSDEDEEDMSLEQRRRNFRGKSRGDREHEKVMNMLSSRQERSSCCCWGCCTTGVLIYLFLAAVITVMGGMVLWSKGVLQPVLAQSMLNAYILFVVVGFVSVVLWEMWRTTKSFMRVVFGGAQSGQHMFGFGRRTAAAA